MKVNIELLCHYNCDLCQKWWSVANIIPANGAEVFCPHCGHTNKVVTTENYVFSTEENGQRVVFLEGEHGISTPE